MADIASLLAQGRPFNFLQNARQFQAMDIANQQAKQQELLTQAKLTDIERQQVVSLDAQKKAELGQRFNQFASVGKDINDEPTFLAAMQASGLPPDKQVWGNPALSFEHKKGLTLAKASDFLSALGGKSDGRTSQIKNYEYFKQLKTPEARKDFQAANRAVPGMKIQDTGGSLILLDPVTNEQIKEIPKTLKPEQKPATIKAQEKAKAVGREEGKKEVDMPKAIAAMESQQARVGMVDTFFDDAEKQANSWTTGMGGKLLKDWSGTAAHDLSQTISSIRSNLGLDKLLEIKAGGGTLGALSDTEMKLLQDAMGALEQSQSPEQFQRNLKRVRQQYNESWDRMRAAYKREYGKEFKGITKKENQSGAVAPRAYMNYANKP